jgi:hypothetical protein
MSAAREAELIPVEDSLARIAIALERLVALAEVETAASDSEYAERKAAAERHAAVSA